MQVAPNAYAKLNCAGQGCPERAGCRRFDLRIADRNELVQGQKVQRFEWASFDLERALAGSCVSRIRMFEVRR